MELLFEFSVCPQPAVGSSHYRLSHTSPVNQNHGSQSPTEPTPAAPPPLITHDEQPSSTNLSLKSQWKPLPLPLASAEWISSSAGPSLQARASPCQSQAPSLPSRLMEAGLCFSSSLPSSKQFDQTVARSRCRWVKRLLCWRAGFQTPLCPSKKKPWWLTKKPQKYCWSFSENCLFPNRPFKENVFIGIHIPAAEPKRHYEHTHGGKLNKRIKLAAMQKIVGRQRSLRKLEIDFPVVVCFVFFSCNAISKKTSIEFLI